MGTKRPKSLVSNKYNLYLYLLFIMRGKYIIAVTFLCSNIRQSVTFFVHSSVFDIQPRVLNPDLRVVLPVVVVVLEVVEEIVVVVVEVVVVLTGVVVDSIGIQDIQHMKTKK